MSEPTIAELFSRDPLKLTTTDLDRIINHMRESRQKFIMGNAKAGTPTTRKTPTISKGAELAKTLNLDLGDLGI